MKNTIFNLLAAGTLTVSMLAFTAPRPAVPARHIQVSASSIKGMVQPADGASFVVAASDKDSARSAVNDGMFTINIKPGSYKVTVVAKAPYKDVVKDNVEVSEGNTTDLGTISLQQ